MTSYASTTSDRRGGGNVGLFVGVLVIVIGLPVLGFLSRKISDGRLWQTGMAIWFVGSPVVLGLGGWLIHRSL
ncbi:hypothetical protein ACFZC6_21285 [Streptomyces ossamyceticus]|uniref:Phospholipase D-like protein n=1 Tax=Streptomyces ossamyceticus TaxID=249581 RepID=A0ABV2UZU5_9ACTN